MSPDADALPEILPLVAAGLLVLAAAGWLAFRRGAEGRWAVRRYLWTGALIDLSLLPAAALSAGWIAATVLVASERAAAAATATDWAQLVAALTLAVGIGRLVEVRFLVRLADDAEGADEPGLSTRLPQLVRGVIYGFALLVGLIVFLTAKGYQPVELYLSTGALAAIVAFAMQQTLGDFFSGVAMSVERPFRLGDWLRLDDGTEGEVIDMNWRATHLRGWDRATHVIPNGTLARKRFANLHDRRHAFAPWYMLSLPAEIDPRDAKSMLLEAALRCERVLAHPVPVVRLVSAATQPYSYMVWVHFANYPAMFAGREELHREVHYALRQKGLQIGVDVQEIRHRAADPSGGGARDDLAVLRRLDFADALSEEELDRLAQAGKRVHHDAGTVILAEGDVGDSLWVVADGVVAGSVLGKNGARHPVEHLGAGAYFGMVSMLTAQPSAMIFEAATDVTLLRYGLDGVSAALTDRPDLTRRLAEMVGRRMARASEARHAAQKPVTHRPMAELMRRIERSLRS